MRPLYFTLSLLMLLGIGSACRTPTALPDGCRAVAPGLTHCPAGAVVTR